MLEQAPCSTALGAAALAWLRTQGQANHSVRIEGDALQALDSHLQSSFPHQQQQLDQHADGEGQ